MRNTFKYASQYTGGSSAASAAQTASGQSVAAPIGGWDAINPLASMPPQNAVQLINFFPQPGWVELRRGHLIYCDTGSGSPVETLMGYMGQNTSKDILMTATGAHIYNVTSGTAVSIGSGYTSNRWQHTNFAGTGGSFTWMCNGSDVPQYWDGTTMTVTTMTGPAGFVPASQINVNVYRDRIWMVQKASTIAYYLPVDSVNGAVQAFDVGNQFLNGGYLQAIGTWSTDANDGPNEYIAFISSQGDAAIYVITDPTTADGINFRGRVELSQPVGYRCVTRIGADLGVITLDGVLPLSQVVTYDKAALIGASITKNIRQAITTSMRASKDNFGWSLTSYPRNTMAILNVPVQEGANQEQYVMNTITGAWGRFQGQYSNCWEVFLDKPYFGDNNGLVHLADAAGGDENQTLIADMQCAWNYFGDRGRLKKWADIRPNITVDQTFPVQPNLGINVDFGTSATLYPVNFDSGEVLALWDVALWDVDVWPGDVTALNWSGADAIGYVESTRITLSLPWTTDLETPKTLKFNGFDYAIYPGAIIG